MKTIGLSFDKAKFNWGSILCGTILLVFLTGCTDGERNPGPDSSRQTPSNQQKTTKPKGHQSVRFDGGMGSAGNSFMISDTRIERLNTRLSDQGTTTSFQERKNHLRTRIQLARSYLRSGQYDRARRHLQQPLGILQSSTNEEVTSILRKIYRLHVYTTLYELIDENCLTPGETDRCFLSREPWKPEYKTATHELQQILSGSLTYFPHVLENRWLLNLLHLKTQTHPEGVPDPWRISRIESSSDTSTRFKNRAPEKKLDLVGRAGSVTMEDFSGNGKYDLMVSEWGFTGGQLRYFVQNEEGEFREQTQEANLSKVKRGLNLEHLDYNNDGHMDLLVLRGAWPRNQPGEQANLLLRNNGSGTFTDVSDSVGLNRVAPTQTVAVADFNRDGWVDLFIGNESTPGQSHPSRLYLNQKGRRLEHVSQQAGVQVNQFVKGATWGDVNNDGWLDLYVSVQGKPNRLFVNEGDTGTGSFREAGKQFGVKAPRSSFATGFLDFNNDGLDDLFVATFRKHVSPVASYFNQNPDEEINSSGPFLYENGSEVGFQPIESFPEKEAINHTMGANAGDLNNDGYPDFVLGTGTPSLSALIPNRLILNRNGSSFSSVEQEYGIDHLLKGHGVAIGDLNDDGQPDIYQVQGGGYPVDRGRNLYFENTGTNNNWIQIRLVGSKSSHTARGARIKIVGRTDGQKRTIFHRISSGLSFGASPLKAEIGLGSIGEIKKLIVRWPHVETSRQEIKNVPVNRSITIREGKTPDF